MKKLFLFALFACCFISPAMADDDPCEEYSYINYVVYTNWNILKYDLSNNGTTKPPHVDSIWITDANDSIMQVYYDVQSGDGIDIAFLERGYYILHVQIADCIMTRMFIARGYHPSDIDIVSDERTRFVTKVLRNGQIFIIRGENVYTMQGQQIK